MVRWENTSDFFSSDAGRCAGVAKQFLDGALILSDAQPIKGRTLFRPTLALAGQGLELMLKACVYHNRRKPPTSGRDGHNIKKLWASDLCEPVRGHVFVNAILVTKEARVSGSYLGVPEDDEV